MHNIYTTYRPLPRMCGGGGFPLGMLLYSRSLAFPSIGVSAAGLCMSMTMTMTMTMSSPSYMAS